MEFIRFYRIFKGKLAISSVINNFDKTETPTISYK